MTTLVRVLPTQRPRLMVDSFRFQPCVTANRYKPAYTSAPCLRLWAIWHSSSSIQELLEPIKKTGDSIHQERHAAITEAAASNKENSGATSLKGVEQVTSRGNHAENLTVSFPPSAVYIVSHWDRALVLEAMDELMAALRLPPAKLSVLTHFPNGKRRFPNIMTESRAPKLSSYLSAWL